ncbi:MAG: HAMP domain-containing histidine kinase [Clostridiales bacterium]|jgi:signal transduction histidine kinase|nr:HAMP domain-containing histidine kinase [Clostridiales bacterium]
MSAIFKKLFGLYTGVILFSFTLLALALSVAFRGYFISQKEESLKKQGEKISYLYARFLSGEIGGLYELHSQFRIIGEYLDSDFIIVGRDFRVLSASEGVGAGFVGKTLSEESAEPFRAALSGKIVTSRGGASEVFAEPAITVGYPVVVDGRAVCVILMSSSVPELQRTIAEVYKIGLWCLAASVGAAFIMAFASSRRISEPLREMSEAAKLIAGGNFDRRVEAAGADEIAQLAWSLNSMAESLSSQEASRKEFIANISHDFRSPLMSIRGFVQAMKEGAAPAENFPRYFGIIISETDRLLKLANDILDLNKIAGTGLALSDFDVNALIKETALGAEERVRAKGLTLSLTFADEASYVRADYEKIERVLQNLLDNAVKFTPPGGKIDVETTLLEGRLRVNVRDTGEGISKADAVRVFERFFKGDAARSAAQSGSGLGLAIVREFISAHGESVVLKSEEGQGCDFEFWLGLSEE